MRDWMVSFSPLLVLYATSHSISDLISDFFHVTQQEIRRTSASDLSVLYESNEPFNALFLLSKWALIVLMLYFLLPLNFSLIFLLHLSSSSLTTHYSMLGLDGDELTQKTAARWREDKSSRKTRKEKRKMREEWRQDLLSSFQCLTWFSCTAKHQ